MPLGEILKIKKEENKPLHFMKFKKYNPQFKSYINTKEKILNEIKTSEHKEIKIKVDLGKLLEYKQKNQQDLKKNLQKSYESFKKYNTQFKNYINTREKILNEINAPKHKEIKGDQKKLLENSQKEHEDYKNEKLSQLNKEIYLLKTATKTVDNLKLKKIVPANAKEEILHSNGQSIIKAHSLRLEVGPLVKKVKENIELYEKFDYTEEILTHYISAEIAERTRLGKCRECTNVSIKYLYENSNNIWVYRPTLYHLDHVFVIISNIKTDNVKTLLDNNAIAIEGWGTSKAMLLKEFLEGNNPYKRKLLPNNLNLHHESIILTKGNKIDLGNFKTEIQNEINKIEASHNNYFKIIVDDHRAEIHKNPVLKEINEMNKDEFNKFSNKYINKYGLLKYLSLKDELKKH